MKKQRTRHAPKKLTVQVIEAMPLPTKEKASITRDTTVRGLFVQVGATGVRAFKIQADLRTAPGAVPVSVRMTIGQHPEMTVERARTEAQRLLAMIKSGQDPRPDVHAAPATGTVSRLYAEWVADIRARGRAPRTLQDAQARFARYLTAWSPLPVASITRAMTREAHARITRDHGPRVANDTLRNFRAAFNWAKKTWDQPLGENPAEAVTYHPQRARKDELTFPDLPTWIAKVRALENPVRSVMHEIGLFSGLRPGTLVRLERSWVKLEARAIEIPAAVMKARVAFALPLSGHMATLVRTALERSETLYPGAAWLFPTRKLDNSAVIATQVWKERTLPSETGYVLRHMYSVAAAQAGVPSVDRMLLLAQKVPGVEGLYLQERALFDRMLEQQERVTAHLLSLIKR